MWWIKRKMLKLHERLSKVENKYSYLRDREEEDMKLRSALVESKFLEIEHWGVGNRTSITPRFNLEELNLKVNLILNKLGLEYDKPHLTKPRLRKGKNNV